MGGESQQVHRFQAFGVFCMFLLPQHALDDIIQFYCLPARVLSCLSFWSFFVACFGAGWREWHRQGVGRGAGIAGA